VRDGVWAWLVWRWAPACASFVSAFVVRVASFVSFVSFVKFAESISPVSLTA
jgi:hypothetical protein